MSTTESNRLSLVPICQKCAKRKADVAAYIFHALADGKAAKVRDAIRVGIARALNDHEVDAILEIIEGGH